MMGILRTSVGAMSLITTIVLGSCTNDAVDNACRGSECTREATCGDGAISGAEICDGENLRQSCSDLGYAGGVLGCSENCQTYLTDQCVGTSAPNCGNGVIEGNEVCDGSTVSQTCEEAGFFAGEVGCSADCSELLFDGCRTGPVCGDGLVEGNEVCDGDNLNGVSCTDLLHGGGRFALYPKLP